MENLISGGTRRDACTYGYSANGCPLKLLRGGAWAKKCPLRYHNLTPKPRTFLISGKMELYDHQLVWSLVIADTYINAKKHSQQLTAQLHIENSKNKKW